MRAGKEQSPEEETLDQSICENMYVGSQVLGYRRDHIEVLPSIKDGVVADRDIVESIWDHAFRECLLVDPKEHPTLPKSSPNSMERISRRAD